MVFWSGVVGPGTNDQLSLARASRSAVVRSRYALKSSTCEQVYHLTYKRSKPEVKKRLLLALHQVCI